MEPREIRRRALAAAATVSVFIAVFLAMGASRLPSAAAAPDGAALFKTYCASCHGIDAMGNGPMAKVLRHNPPDLTRIALKNMGVFPAARMRRIIEGRDVESHGDRDMPVWGDAFKMVRDGQADTPADRIEALVQFLDSIQQRLGQ
jgi:mono/diheme cytochrome c family protein